jgi:hypothetical protein
MKRYYLTDILGTGQADVDEFRPVPAEYRADFSWSMPSDANGMPLNNWGLVEVTMASDAALVGMAADPRLDELPFVARETLVAEIDPAAVARMRDALIRRGIGVDFVNASTFGNILDNITWRSNHP